VGISILLEKKQRGIFTIKRAKGQAILLEKPNKSRAGLLAAPD
jgi:hypothetical protein